MRIAVKNIMEVEQNACIISLELNGLQAHSQEVFEFINGLTDYSELDYCKSLMILDVLDQTNSDYIYAYKHNEKAYIELHGKPEPQMNVS
ncbi:hypothetical protein ACQVPP_17630 [Bacillus luti]|uniref:hypothetical protein n=1 Tax=Bacillus luti TaxID=2026191 RepID=UPI003D648C68